MIQSVGNHELAVTSVNFPFTYRDGNQAERNMKTGVDHA